MNPDFEGAFYILTDEHAKASVSAKIGALKPAKDNPLAVKIAPYKLKRSDLQNRYLWGWVYGQIVKILADGGIVINCEDGREVPYTKDILHEIFKGKFLVKEVIESKGKTLALYESTAKLESDAFWQYCKSVKEFCWQFWKITVPEPQDGAYKTYAEELS